MIGHRNFRKIIGVNVFLTFLKKRKENKINVLFNNSKSKLNKERTYCIFNFCEIIIDTLGKTISFQLKSSNKVGIIKCLFSIKE